VLDQLTSVLVVTPNNFLVSLVERNLSSFIILLYFPIL
jgi:hypothetical protein